ncbi:MAG: ABC transporter ATP-binding protein [Geminicoccaceae bacterium]
MLVVRDLTVHAAKDRLMGPVSFTLPAGDALVIMGETGAGKSLLAQSIMGALPVTLHGAGEITLESRRIDNLSSAEREALWGRAISLLPQEPWRALDPLMPAFRQVRDSHRLVGRRPPAEAEARARQDFEVLSLTGAERRRPGQLSGGMGQRVAFAAACAGGARLLLADEPTKGLDRDRTDTIIRLLKQTPEDGGALIVVTHDIAVARAIDGQILVLRNGVCVEQGAVGEVLANPQHAYTLDLIAADPANWQAPVASAPGKTVLEAQGIAIGRGQERLIEGFDLSLGAGERVAVTGPSGIGKTTLLDTLAGLLSPLAGTVRRGTGVGRTGVQKIYQDPPAAFPRLVSLGIGLRDLAELHRIAWEDIRQLVTRLRVDEAMLERRPEQVSGGELQRIAIARALAVKPAVLLADEPTSRLDPITQKQTMALLAEAAAGAGTAVVLVTHEAALARNWAMRTHMLT